MSASDLDRRHHLSMLTQLLVYKKSNDTSRQFNSDSIAAKPLSVHFVDSIFCVTNVIKLDKTCEETLIIILHKNFIPKPFLREISLIRPNLRKASSTSRPSALSVKLPIKTLPILAENTCLTKMAFLLCNQFNND